VFYPSPRRCLTMFFSFFHMLRMWDHYRKWTYRWRCGRNAASALRRCIVGGSCRCNARSSPLPKVLNSTEDAHLKNMGIFETGEHLQV
jgi:hypothetical protein